QRTTDDVGQVQIFPARELLPTDEVRGRAERLLATAPWGREQWQRLADGELFDGMESWLPWLAGPDPNAEDGPGSGEHVLFDLVGPDGQILLAEPRRLRDRAADIA